MSTGKETIPASHRIIRTTFLDQDVKLPLRLSEKDVGVVLDDDGRDVFTVDVNNERADEEAAAIALNIVECVNAEAGFSSGASKPYCDMTLAELEAEYASLDTRIRQAPAWGAHLAALSECRHDCASWLRRRRAEVAAKAEGER